MLVGTRKVHPFEVLAGDTLDLGITDLSKVCLYFTFFDPKYQGLPGEPSVSLHTLDFSTFVGCFQS